MRVQHSVLQIDQVVVDHIGECVEGFLFERPPIWMLDIACDDPFCLQVHEFMLGRTETNYRTLMPLLEHGVDRFHVVVGNVKAQDPVLFFEVVQELVVGIVSADSSSVVVKPSRLARLAANFQGCAHCKAFGIVFRNADGVAKPGCLFNKEGRLVSYF